MGATVIMIFLPPTEDEFGTSAPNSFGFASPSIAHKQGHLVVVYDLAMRVEYKLNTMQAAKAPSCFVSVVNGTQTLRKPSIS
jgi:hypothetical protein